ncbi:tetratricopeptide repeat protein, partial [bacterium]|nr:tetratricopeptide repeat protein [bacterium]
MSGAKTSSLERFEREMRLLSSFEEKDGIVPLLDAGESENGPYLIMPFIGGGTLRERLKRGPLPVAETVALGKALASACGRAHELGIVHRDLKPENVLFQEDGRPLIADLGLAKHFREDVPGASQSVSLTHLGEIRGTAGYMAPEQMASAKSVGARADVFALGAILYECLAGEPAFHAATVVEIFAKLTKGEVAPLRAHCPRAPRWLTDVIERALAREPADRFEDGAALARALSRGETEATRAPALLIALAGGAVLALLVGGAFVLGGVYSRGQESDRPGSPPAPVASGSTDTKQVQAAANAARTHLKSGQYDLAIERANKALELDPRNADALATRGDARHLKGDLDGAIADCSRAIELDARYARAREIRGHVKADKGDFDGAIADASRAIELEPDDVGALEVRGMARLMKHDREGALSDLNRTIALDSKRKGAWSDRAAIKLDMARRQDGTLDMDALEGAIADATQAIALDERMAQAWGIRGQARFFKGAHDPALADLTRAIELDQRIWLAWLDRGCIHAQRWQWDAAIADFNHAIEQRPGLIEAWLKRGEARRAKKDLDGAIADFTHAIDIDPRMGPALLARSEARHEKGDLEGAIADVERLLAQAPESAPALYARGCLHSEKGEDALAIADLERCMKAKQPKMISFVEAAKKKIEEVRAKERKSP